MTQCIATDQTNLRDGSLERRSAPLSVIIPVKNEEANIVECLASVAWAAETIVVDSSSKDKTASLAETMGAKVVQFEYRAGGPKKKNWALDNIPLSNGWVLILDADERITPALASEIRNVISTDTVHSGWYINRRFYFLGRWIRHAGYFPSWNLRLFRHDRARYERFPPIDTNSGDNEVHEHVLLRGCAGYLIEPMDHFAYRDVSQFVEKHNRYSNWEAILGDRVCVSIGAGSDQTWFDAASTCRRKVKQLVRKVPFPHWARFVYHYFLRGGFLDGIEGYMLCHMLAEYEFWIWAKQRERRTVGT